MAIMCCGQLVAVSASVCLLAAAHSQGCVYKTEAETPAFFAAVNEEGP